MFTLSALGDQFARSLPSLNLTGAQLLVGICALTVHIIYHKLEVEPENFLVSCLLLGVVPLFPFPFVSRHFSSPILSIILTYSLFFSVLALSIILYRVSPFHPLAEHPGPLSLKISKFGTLLYTYNGKQHIFFKRLHDRYGPCVRVGPNELSIVDIGAILPIFGTDGTRKGPQYIASVQPGTIPNIITLRNVDEHRERRKLWSRAFTPTALKDHHPMVANRVLQLVEELSKHATHGNSEGKFVDLAEWMAFFAYDSMGDLVFNGGLELMRDGDDRSVIATLEKMSRYVGRLKHIPWICGLVWRLSLTSEDQIRFTDFAMKCLNDRKQRGSTRRNLFHLITNEDEDEVPADQALNDTITAIIAGSDTTSAVLGGLFCYILTHHEVYKRLQAEVDEVFPHGEEDPFDAVKLAEMPYLNAVINEALRLQPPVPTSLQRSPLERSGGKWVAGRFIPENTALYVPPYVLHRDERYFSPSPDKFIPERWLHAPTSSSTFSSASERQGEFTTNTAAFIPFSSGPANCAGKSLALLDMRMVVAALVQRFEMRLEGGYDLCEWEEDLEDFYLMKVGKLPVVLTARD